MKFLKFFLSFLYPTICPECEKVLDEGMYWCEPCLRKNSSFALLNTAFDNNMDGCYTLSTYKGGIRKALIQLKYNNKRNRRKAIHCLFDEFPCWDRLKKYEIAVPIPLSKEHLIKRGYNQVDLIFKDILIQKKFYYNENILIKQKNTKIQSKLRFEERIGNVKDVFSVNKNINIKNKNILLLDDIYTTGATMKSAAKVLKFSGAKSVLGLVVSSGAK